MQYDVEYRAGLRANERLPKYLTIPPAVSHCVETSLGNMYRISRIVHVWKIGNNVNRNDVSLLLELDPVTKEI